MKERRTDLYRQVEPMVGQPVFFDSTTGKLNNYAIFLPTRSDEDGLSLIDASHRSRRWSCHRKEKPGSEFALICLDRAHVVSVGQQVGFAVFEIRTTPDAIDKDFGEPHAHCVAVPINRRDYDNDRRWKEKCKSWARKLSEDYRESVIGPFSGPLKVEDYRPTH